ncbi:MAG: hypothetical protein U0414_01580 [Polyangiaceae bacterium]
MGSLATLIRWLGPLAPEGKPAHVSRAEITIPGGARALRAYVHVPIAAPKGVYLLLPGLHYLGPDDTRLDRFASVLAAAGFVVVAPFFPDAIELLLAPTMFTDAETALHFAIAEAERRSLPPPALFSISFGSILALHLAAHPEFRGRASRGLLFGGFAELFPAVEYAVTGRALYQDSALRAKRDPLNSPVVFMNLLPHLALPAGADRELLLRAWRTMVHRTWGRTELKLDGARDPHAHAIARGLPDELRLPFLRGCGVAPGSFGWLKEGIAAAGDAMTRFDAGDRPARVHTPLTLVHGRDDDVIPYFESLKIAERLPPEMRRRTCITGLYGHTASARPTLGAIAAEARALYGMLSDLAGER